MTDKEILKRVEDRLEVAMTLVGEDYSLRIITGIRDYIRKCKHLQKKLGWK